MILLPTRPNTVRPSRSWEVLDDFNQSNTAVNGLTVLLPWTNLGQNFESLNAIIENLSASATCDLIVSVSHNGNNASGIGGYKITANPLEEVDFRVVEPNPYTWIKVAANSASAITINWAMLGIRRY